ncbi:2-dehydropantoate 2-reductase N-terminal domain-containing protein [Paenibacillus sp. FSL H8-0122]|uniref:ketopantoate reductase family protein n=1 Tax=Paenibacillus sp. FSL H8-0122 TaxID=2954510 RepID=UPI0030F75670
MSAVKQNRILIFGAGVIGSIYAMKFMEAGFDVSLFARSDRFRALQEKGLQYNDKGTVRTIPVKVMDTLENDDIYDFIFVTVRYDRAESALLALKDNQSPNIVTMTNSSIGFSSWRRIVGDRLLPAFPGFGGQIKDGVLYARFMPKLLVATTFGEMNGAVTQRIVKLSQVFQAAKLPYAIKKNMQAYLITHSVSDIALLGGLYSGHRMTDPVTPGTRQTARQITVTLKAYLKAIRKAGVAVDPPFFKIVPKLPSCMLDLLFIAWLRTNMVKDMLLPDYANAANQEVVQLENDLTKFLTMQNG